MKHPWKTTVVSGLALALLIGAVGTGAYAAGVLAERGASKVTVDGKAVELEGYQIDGENYFKLRDIAKAVGFGVTWDSAANTVRIDTTSGYVSESAAAGQTNSGVVALSAFRQLDVDLGVGDLQVKTGETYSVKLESRGKNGDGIPYELHYTNDNGTLTIWSTPRRMNNGKDLYANVTITVPKGTSLTAADLMLGMGDLEWTGCGVAGPLEFDLGMGDADVSGNLTGNIRIYSGMGDVLLDLEGSSDAYSYSMWSGMGSMSVDGRRQRGISCKGGEGTAAITINTGMGDIALDFGG